MTFEEYLLSKKIDSKAFAASEPRVWSDWKTEFEQMHPNSFTVQKLNLINPIRRKYPLPVQEVPKVDIEPAQPKPSAPVVAKPMMRPKPKMN